MSTSDPSHPPETVLEEIKATVCPEGTVENSATLMLFKLLVIPVGTMLLEREGQPGIIAKDYHPFTVEGAPYGAVLSVEAETEKNQFRHYSSYEEIEGDFLAGRVSSNALEKVVSRIMGQLLSYIRRSYKENPEWPNVAKLAYPDNEE